MPSEEKVELWCQMISAQDSKFDLQLGLKPGCKWEVPPPYPNLKVVNAKEVHVRRFVLQKLTVEAEEPENDNGAYINVQRLVAELEDGSEVEFSRIATPDVDGEAVELDGICKACDLKIVDKSEIVMHEGKQYHRRCM